MSAADDPDVPQPAKPITRLLSAKDIPSPQVHAWQFVNLEQEEKKRELEIRSAVYEQIQRELEPQITRQTAILKREAYEEAKQAGYEEGYQAGFETGQAQGLEKAQKTAQEALAPQVQTMESILNYLVRPQAEIEQAVYRQVVQIALALAESITEQAIQADPGVLIHFVEQAVAILPEEDASLDVEVSPQDLELIQYYQQQQAPHWQLKGNAKLEPGTCRIKYQNSVVNHNWKARLQALIEKTQFLVAAPLNPADEEPKTSGSDQNSSVNA